jgi:hypothetical protein
MEGYFDTNQRKGNLMDSVLQTDIVGHSNTYQELLQISDYLHQEEFKDTKGVVRIRVAFPKHETIIHDPTLE